MEIIKVSSPFVVYAEETPNPSVMKFVTDKMLLPPLVQLEYTQMPVKGEFPLGEHLLKFPFIEKIYINTNFISIHKKDAVEWTDIYMEVRNFISEFLNKNGFILNLASLNENTVNQNSEHSGSGIGIKHNEPGNETEKKIVEILDHYIRPGVESDGGFIAFRKLENKKLFVELRGSCRGCPSSMITLKNGIEALMKRLLPDEVEEVISIQD
jgi:Fe-S cluster biogenesis protein NfuA